VAAFAFENRAYLAGPGGAKLLAIMHEICGHTDAIRRYVRPDYCREPGANNDEYWRASNTPDTLVCDFDATKLDKNALFTWICQQSMQYSY
jgi:hypothetical protein